MLLSVSF
ncbi:unnamed protein product [Acanthoscelides obtectus]|nr:unnamed protein product [Acanthoscelides obtectus]CAK1682247.1 hypothetical protein AOBTE_LOCUS33508 [Acanthoscelides obtectus]